MSSGFITESEILEERRRRQEEWDKVRTEDQPKEAPEAPEEVYDGRPLFQRLEEQRLKKEADFEEAHKLKNMIRGLDDDEVGFLDLVEHTKAKVAQQITLEEQKEMREFRERVSTLNESEEMIRLRAQIAPAKTTVVSNSNNSQKNKLQGLVVRKRKASEAENDKKDNEEPPQKVNGTSNNDRGEVVHRGGLISAGVLPGLGHYDSDLTSDSDSSDSEHEDTCHNHIDLLGRHASHHSDEEKSKPQQKS